MLTVEDGTGLPNADSFVSLADCEASHLAINGVAWAGTDVDKEAAIRRASQYLSALKWVGNKNTREQALAWPRTNAVDADGFDIASDEVPIEVADATCLLAFFELDNPNGLFPQFTAGQAQQSVTVGPISVSFATARSVEDVRPVITAAMDRIRGLLSSGRGTKFVGRA